ncbi:MAG: 30S ribosomal protein S9 [Aquificaceae bacterium]
MKLKSFRLGFDNSYYATGRRKESIARVWLVRDLKSHIVRSQSTGKEYSLEEYLQRQTLSQLALYPLKLSGLEDRFGVFATVQGGGISGQAQAIMHGIARALVRYNQDLKPMLKRAGLLKRDSRKKERKKYGLMKARKAYRWSKR